MFWAVMVGVTSCDWPCIVTCWVRQAGNKYVWQVGKAVNMWKASKAVNISGRLAGRQGGKARQAWLLTFCTVTANVTARVMCDVTACDWQCIVTCWVRQAGNKYVWQVGKAVNMSRGRQARQ